MENFRFWRFSFSDLHSIPQLENLQGWPTHVTPHLRTTLDPPSCNDSRQVHLRGQLDSLSEHTQTGDCEAISIISERVMGLANVCRPALPGAKPLFQVVAIYDILTTDDYISPGNNALVIRCSNLRHSPNRFLQ